MSWKDLFKPQDKDPKNIVEWLGLITDDIKKLKNTDNWYDEVNLLTNRSIIDNLETDVSDFALSARQGYLLNQKIGISDQNISVLEENVSQLQLDMEEVNNKITEIKDIDIKLINDNIDNINNKLSEYGETLETHETNIEKNKTNISELDTRVSDNETEINSLDERVTTNETNITSIGERVTNNENDITDINTNIESIEEDISDIRGDIEIGHMRIESLVGTNVKINGLEVSINSSNTELSVSPGKAIIRGKLIEVKQSIIKEIDPLLLTQNTLLYTLLSLEEETNNVVVSLSETDMDVNSLRIHSMILNNGSIIESSNNSNMVPISSIVGISADNEAANIRETIPSGFTILGELDYDYMKNNENQIKFKTKSVAYVHGYKIEIPAGTIVNIDKAPEKESRDDLLFLEAWKDIDFPKTGQLKWRIRYINDADFTYYKDCFHISGTNWQGVEPCAQGGNDQPTHININTPKDLIRVFCNIDSKYTDYIFRNLSIDDIGLYLSGDGTDNSKAILKTLDGYCYAIPMFRLYRRPSCGKIEPYEFDKINKLCDYDKVKTLVTSEKVERVKSETIYGKTLLNHCTTMKSLIGAGVASSDKVPGFNTYKITATSSGSLLIITSSLDTLLPSTEYTILVDVDYDTTHEIYIGDRIGDEAFSNTFIPNTKLSYGNNKIKFTTGQTKVNEYQIWLGRTDGMTNGTVISIKNLMILEGDWTNSSYSPSYFEGLSSLGEAEYNLIKVKNGIIQYPTYNPVTGNLKLETSPLSTNIISDNIITPEFEAEVKRDGQKISDFSSFGKIETNGDEIIEFNKIKGKTIHNISTPIGFNFPVTFNANGEVHYHDLNVLFKPKTLYTLIYRISKNTLNSNFSLMGWNSIGIDDWVHYVGSGVTGVYYTTFTTGDNVSLIINMELWKENTSGSITIDGYAILEGDYSSNTEIEHLLNIQSIKSVGENEDNKIILLSKSKNLFNYNKCKDGIALSQLENTYSDINSFTSDPIKVIPNNKVTLSKVKWGWFLDSNLKKIGGNFGGGNNITKTLQIPSNCHYLRFTANISDKYLVQVEYGESMTPYSSYKEYKQNIHLKEPLRSLPNGVCDEIVGNKVIRRVGKIVLDGSENWLINYWANQTNTIGFEIKFLNNYYASSSNLYCDLLVPTTHTAIMTEDSESICLEGSYGVLGLRITRTKLSATTTQGIKTWLSQNPTTIYYELATPIEEYLENEYDKESIKTYQLDAPLRSLPNGVKDEIKDGVLIRRCGEIILDGSLDFVYFTDERHGNNTYFTQTTFPNCKSFASVITDTLRWSDDMWYNTVDIEGIHVHTNTTVQIRLLKSKIPEGTLDGLKKYLNNNPIKVIYELSTPIYIRLNETHNLTSDYSLNRQFKEGNWLRVLPNGVKDIVQNNKVIRKVGKIVIDGTKGEYSTNTDPGIIIGTDTIIFDIRFLFDGIMPGYEEQSNLLCNLFKSNVRKYLNEHDCEGITNWQVNGVRIRINKNRLSSEDVSGFKQWLSQNPVTVYYEYATPIEEALNDTNYTYYPCHEQFNIICSSLYTTDGYNNIEVLNNIKSSDNIIETEYRVIENNSDVNDTKYKPSINGKNLSYKIPKGKNKINMFDYTLNESTNNCIIYKDINELIVSTIESSRISFPLRWFVNLKPNTSYTISCDVESTSINNYRIHVYDYPSDMQITSSNYIGNSLVGISSSKKTASFKTGSNGSIIVTFLIANDINIGANSYAPNIPFYISNLQIEEGSSKTDYEDFIPDIRVFENIESNDVGDLRNLVSLTGYNYEQMLNKTFDMLLNGEI